MLYAKTMCSTFTDPPWEARAEGIRKYQIYIKLGFLTPQSKAFCEQCLVVQAVTRTPGRARWLWRGPVGAVCTAFIGEVSKWNGMERQKCQSGDGSQGQRAAEWLILPLHGNPHLTETDSGIDLWQLTTAPVSLGLLAWAASSLPLVSSDSLAQLCRVTPAAEPGMVSVAAMILSSSPSGQCCFLHLPTCKWTPSQLQGKRALECGKALGNKDAGTSHSGDANEEYWWTCAE